MKPLAIAAVAAIPAWLATYPFSGIVGAWTSYAVVFAILYLVLLGVVKSLWGVAVITIIISVVSWWGWGLKGFLWCGAMAIPIGIVYNVLIAIKEMLTD